MARLEVKPLYKVRVLPLVKDRPGYHRRWINKNNWDVWKERGYDKVQGSEKILADGKSKDEGQASKTCREMVLVECPQENFDNHKKMISEVTKHRMANRRKEAKRAGVSGEEITRKGGRIVLDSKEDDSEEDN